MNWFKRKKEEKDLNNEPSIPHFKFTPPPISNDYAALKRMLSLALDSKNESEHKIELDMLETAKKQLERMIEECSKL